MDPVIIRIAESIDIHASPPTVFALVSDPAAKLALNPFVTVIRVEREGAGEGAVTFLRFQKGQRFVEYRSRCVAFVPDRLIESQAELPTLLRVLFQVDPIESGTRLTQHEECEVTPEMLEHLLASQREEGAWRAMKLIHLVLPILAREAYAMIFHDRVETARKTMSVELYAWLEHIKRHLESGTRATVTPA
jgi:hypothetical protein